MIVTCADGHEVVLQLMGLAEITELFEIGQQTATIWRHRGVLPREDVLLSGRTPGWELEKLLAWGLETERLTAKQVAAKRKAWLAIEKKERSAS